MVDRFHELVKKKLGNGGGTPIGTIFGSLRSYLEVKNSFLSTLNNKVSDFKYDRVH